MIVQSWKLVCVLFFISIGCAGPSKPDPMLEEAFHYHEQSLQTAEESHEILSRFKADDQFRIIMESRLVRWSENLIEVPGFEHDHNHDHHHDHHSHSSQIELTPEDMLVVQKELLDSVQVIKKELQLYTDSIAN